MSKINTPKCYISITSQFKNNKEKKKKKKNIVTHSKHPLPLVGQCYPQPRTPENWRKGGGGDVREEGGQRPGPWALVGSLDFILSIAGSQWSDVI